MIEIMNQLESLERYCQKKSIDTDADLILWLGYAQALERAIFHLKCLYSLSALSCTNCIHSGVHCDCSAYLGKAGRLAGEDWCENYFPADTGIKQ